MGRSYLSANAPVGSTRVRAKEHTLPADPSSDHEVERSAGFFGSAARRCGALENLTPNPSPTRRGVFRPPFFLEKGSSGFVL